MEFSIIVLSKDFNIAILENREFIKTAKEVILVLDTDTDTDSNVIPHNLDKKIKVYKRCLNSDFSAQRNFGLEKAGSEWVLFVDSDEVVPKASANEIVNAVKSDEFVGFTIKRRDTFLGRTLNHGETGSVKLLRLGKRSAGRWHGKVHEEWQVEGRVGELENALIHNRTMGISEFLERINFYTTIRAQELYENKVSEPLMYIVLYPTLKFFLNYIVKLGFLDGFSGFVMAWMMSWHSFLVRIKLRLLHTDNNKQSTYTVK